tara:strand:+ start:1591 stop:2160 length:570 start_codon:yes stop_codon:yes gene_type:complete
MSFSIVINSKETLNKFAVAVAEKTKLSTNAMKTAISKGHGCDNISGLESKFNVQLPQGASTHAVIVKYHDEKQQTEVFYPDAEDSIVDLFLQVLERKISNFEEYDHDDVADIIESGREGFGQGDVVITPVDECNLSECDNCGFIKEHDELPDARDLLQRLSVGGTFTDKECPHCLALCFPLDIKKHEGR